MRELSRFDLGWRGGADRSRQGGIEVAVVEDDRGILAPEFELLEFGAAAAEMAAPVENQ